MPSDATPPDEARAILDDLVAARLVSHELIGDPARIGSEAACLRLLCALVAGPVYRVSAYHYAFRLTGADLGGDLESRAPGEWGAVLAGRLGADLGAEAVWIEAIDLLPQAEAAMSRPLLLLRAHETAVTDALASADPDLHAIISARFAASCAREAAGLDAGRPLAARLDALDSRLETLAARMERENAARTEALDALAGSIAALSKGLADLRQAAAAPAPDLSDFETRLGLSLAEFLARIETRDEEARAILSVPQFS